ncbi:hypothetical protein ACJJTC_019798 [Scirpophaga incertulas]
MFIFVVLFGLVAFTVGQESTADKLPKGFLLCGLNAGRVKCTSKCSPTCADLNPICEQSCGPPGCQCLPGFVRDTDGSCILPENCPGKQCGYNEVYTENRPACPPETCDTLYVIYDCAPPPQDETKIVQTPGCKCIDYHLRNSSGICIPVEQCPPRRVKQLCSDPNAEYRFCASACTPTCDDPNQNCIQSCQPGRCQCKSGYVLLDGKCILPENCPGKNICDDPNAEYKQCASACTPTCEDRTPNCIQSCQPARCQCKSGYVMSGGKCILPVNCPSQPCGDPNAVYRECASACVPTCKNPYPVCNDMCRPGRCQCKDGYVMFNGSCIPLSTCPGMPNAELQ